MKTKEIFQTLFIILMVFFMFGAMAYLLTPIKKGFDEKTNKDSLQIEKLKLEIKLLKQKDKTTKPNI